MMAEKPILDQKSRALKEKDSRLRFPGMKITDQVSFGKKILTRYTTTAKSYHGDPFIAESILCISTKEEFSHKNADAESLILIGSNKFDCQLNLIRRHNIKLFDIPIISFSVNFLFPSDKLELVGWNRTQIQAIRIDCHNQSEAIKETIKVVDVETKDIDSTILIDQSTQFNDYISKQVILVDKTKPYYFYCLSKD